MFSFLYRAFGWLGVWILLALVGFVVYAFFTQYSPSQSEDISTLGDERVLDEDTITILSWNIGYAGLGSDMDFFMDGGESSRTSRGRTEQNLSAIVNFIDSLSGDLDFIFLQEVDVESKRAYGINEYDTLVSRFGTRFKTFFAPNFDVFYVPIPVGDAIGQVEAGLVTMSRYSPREAKRVALPSGGSFPQSLFDLKRCMLSIAVPLSSGELLWLCNTHNSAYDDGSQRVDELEFLGDYLSERSYFVVAGDWNSTPPSYEPSVAERENQYFSPLAIKRSDFDSSYHFAADLSSYTARFGYEPYDVRTTTRTLIDFGLSSAAVVPLSVKTIDLGFEHSDHNPVLYRFVIKH